MSFEMIERRARGRGVLLLSRPLLLSLVCLLSLAANLIACARTEPAGASSEPNCARWSANAGRCKRAGPLPPLDQDGEERRFKIGILLEESNYEQANMFIRTIKMINEQKDETISRLLNMFAVKRNAAAGERQQPAPAATGGSSERGVGADYSQTEAGRAALGPGLKLEPLIEFLSDRQSALEADEKVCQLIGSGARAIMGPVEGQSIQHVQSICDRLEIPYFELRPFVGGSGVQGGAGALAASVGPARSPAASAARPEELTLNLHPPSQLLNAAYIDLIHALNWTSFAIVYEGADSLIRLQNIFKESSAAANWANKWRIRLFRHAPADELAGEQHVIQALGPARRNASGSPSADEPQSGPDQPQSKRSISATFRDVFWRVKMSGEHNVLLDVKTARLYEALRAAQQVGCVTEEFSYLVTSLDLHAIELEDFKYSRTKITSFSMLQVAKWQQSALRSGATGRALEQRPYFDEKYLETLGVHSIQSAWGPAAAAASQQQRSVAGKPTSSDSNLNSNANANANSNSTPNSKARGQAANWAKEAESNDQTRRELLQSSPASLGLLPMVDRNNEQRLFDFFLEQQERNLSRVRLSTAGAILHDSLLLLVLALNELDPSGSFLARERRLAGPLTEAADESDLPAPPSCSLDSAPWPHGSSLVNYMKQLTFTGLTGRVAFDQRGLRNELKLDIMGMAPNIRLVKVGEWHSDSRASFKQAPAAAAGVAATATSHRARAELEGASKSSEEGASKEGEAEGRAGSEEGAGEEGPDGSALAEEASKSYDELASRYESQLAHYAKQLAAGKQVQVPYTKRVTPSGALLVNEIIFERLYREQADKIDTLIVTAKLSQPYFMLKETPSKLDGNDQFEGFAVDLIHELAKLVNFKYKWREVADKKYGSKEVLANGTIVWNGMIGEIVRGQADLAIVDLTITTQRQEAVDFTLPFMNTGISILFKKPTTKVTTLFSFLSPFSSDVWAYVLAAYCGISAILFLVGHLSPYEWADPHPCRHLSPDNELTVLRNQFSLLNSFWFTIGSLMQQGSDLTPRSMSTRTIAGIWYFFTLIMISSYTANLAAFLTVEKVVYPIENVRDLSNQQEIKYGCIEAGSTCLFFQDSQIDTYKKIDETMRRHRTYVRSNDEGQKRVGEGKFAFFMESTTIEYIIERNCNLTQIGGLMDSKGYGLATSKKPRHKRPYRTLLNEGILHLQETGMLHVLKNRWWKEKRGGGTCTDDGKGGGVTELSLANVGGVFVVLLGGLGISFLVAIAEFIWRARRSGSTRDRMCEEMMNDLRFALACKSSTKPIGGGGGGGAGGSRSANAGGSSQSASNSSQSGAGREIGGTRTARASGGFGRRLSQSESSDDESDEYCGPNELAASQAGASRLLAANQHQQQQQRRQRPQRTNAKACDPILLHAMLTMLAQQQQGAPAPAPAPPPPPPPAPLRACHSSELGGLEVKRRAASHGRPTSDDCGALATQTGPFMMSHSATMDENLARRLVEADERTALAYAASFSDAELDEQCAGQPVEGPVMPAVYHFQRLGRAKSNGGEAAAADGAQRRRPLHTQQTIDID